jgi:transcriptional regulator with XRE-family HTH domain
MEDKRIFEKLREFRRARGISVDDLAKELGENSQKVARIERGQRSLTVDYLLRISKALSTPIETLLDEQTQKEGHFDSDILNDVVVLIEELAHKLPMGNISQQKAKMISKIYELILKLPNEKQRVFFNFLRDSLNILFQSAV